MTDDVEAIAAGLTKAQREAVLLLTGEWTIDDVSPQAVRLLWDDAVVALRPHLIEYRKRRITTWRPLHEMRLTPPGLRVRQYLEAHTDQTGGK